MSDITSAAAQAEEQPRKSSCSQAKCALDDSSNCDSSCKAAAETTCINRQSEASRVSAKAKPERNAAEETLPLREEIHESSQVAAAVETEANQTQRPDRESVGVERLQNAAASDEPAVKTETVAQPSVAARITSDAANSVGLQLSPISPPTDASLDDEDVDVVQRRTGHRPIASPLRRRSQRLSDNRRTDEQGDKNSSSQASDAIAGNVTCPITPKLHSVLALANAQVPVPETPDTKVPHPTTARHQEVHQRSCEALDRGEQETHQQKREEQMFANFSSSGSWQRPCGKSGSDEPKVTSAEGAGGKALILASVSDSRLLDARSRNLQEDLLNRLGFISFTSPGFGGTLEARPVEQKDSLPVSQVDESRVKHIILPIPPEKVVPVSKSNVDEAVRHLHRASEKEEFAFLVKQVAPSVTRLQMRPTGAPALTMPAIAKVDEGAGRSTASQISSEKEVFSDKPQQEQAAYRQQLAGEREEFTLLVKKVTGARHPWRLPPGPYKNSPEHAWAAEIHGPTFGDLKDNAWVS